MPRSPYTLSVPALVLAVLSTAVEQWVGGQGWWQTVPWGWVSLVLAALVAGSLWADLNNAASPLRARWRERHRAFEVRAAYIQEESQPHLHFEIVCLFRVLRDLGPSRLTVRVTELTRPGRTHLVHDEALPRVPKDYERRLRLGSVAVSRPGVPARHSVWGESLGSTSLPPGQPGIVGAGRFLIDMELSGQSYRLLMAACPPAMHSGPPPYFLLGEEDFPERVG